MGFWEQLNTFKIGSNAGSQIQKQSNPIHLEEINEDKLKSVKLVNDATLRSDGGIIPGTISAIAKEFTDNGQIALITPAVGEVWQILFPIAKVTAGSVSTTVEYEFWLEDNATSVQYRIYFYSSTSSSPIPNEDSGLWSAPLYIGEGQTLYGELGSFSATKIQWGVLAGRVR